MDVPRWTAAIVTLNPVWTIYGRVSRGRRGSSAYPAINTMGIGWQFHFLSPKLFYYMLVINFLSLEWHMYMLLAFHIFFGVRFLTVEEGIVYFILSMSPNSDS